MAKDAKSSSNEFNSHGKRLNWALEKVGWNSMCWGRVVFTEEKKFNLGTGWFPLLLARPEERAFSARCARKIHAKEDRRGH